MLGAVFGYKWIAKRFPDPNAEVPEGASASPEDGPEPFGTLDELVFYLRCFYYGFAALYALFIPVWFAMGDSKRAMRLGKSLVPKIGIATFLHFKWQFNNSLFIGPIVTFFDVWELAFKDIEAEEAEAAKRRRKRQKSRQRRTSSDAQKEN